MGSKRCRILSYHRMTPSSKAACKLLPLFLTPPYPFLLEYTLTLGGLHRKQFSLASDFPSSNLLVRNPAGEPARSLYLTNDLIRAVLSMNDYRRIRLMTAGTKIFTRQEGGFGRGAAGGGEERIEKVTRFRLLNEGLPVVLPYIKPESIIDTDLRALRRLLETYYPLLNVFDEAFQRVVGSKRTYKLSVHFFLFLPRMAVFLKCVNY
jgi:hypothetical protein